MNEKEFVELIEKIVEAKPGTLSLSSKTVDIDWDSVAMLSFISEVDTRLGLELDLKRLVAAESVGDLFSLVTHA